MMKIVFCNAFMCYGLKWWISLDCAPAKWVSSVYIPLLYLHITCELYRRGLMFLIQGSGAIHHMSYTEIHQLNMFDMVLALITLAPFQHLPLRYFCLRRLPFQDTCPSATHAPLTLALWLLPLCDTCTSNTSPSGTFTHNKEIMFNVQDDEVSIIFRMVKFQRV